MTAFSASHFATSASKASGVRPLAGILIFDLGHVAIESNRSAARRALKYDGHVLPRDLSSWFEERKGYLPRFLLPCDSQVLRAARMLDVNVSGQERERVGDALRAWVRDDLVELVETLLVVGGELVAPVTRTIGLEG